MYISFQNSVQPDVIDLPHIPVFHLKLVLHDWAHAFKEGREDVQKKNSRTRFFRGKSEHG